MGKHTVSLDPADLRRWYVDDGLSVRQIGALTGVPYKSVQRHLIWAGVERRPPGPGPVPFGNVNPVTEAEAAEIRAAFAADPHLPIAEASRRFGRADGTIYKFAGGLRVPARRARGARFGERFQELYDQGLRGYQIDRAMGWYKGNAAYHQRRLGLDPLRPLPEPGELRRLYDEDWTTKALARRLGVSRRRVTEALRAAGIKSHRGHNGKAHPLDAHTGALRSAYVDGKVEIEDLAPRYGVKASTMRNFLQSRGITRTPRLTAADHERILALAASGMSLNAIAREIGCAAPTVKWHLRHPQQQRRRRIAA